PLRVIHSDRRKRRTPTYSRAPAGTDRLRHRHAGHGWWRAPRHAARRPDDHRRSADLLVRPRLSDGERAGERRRVADALHAEPGRTGGEEDRRAPGEEDEVTPRHDTFPGTGEPCAGRGMPRRLRASKFVGTIEADMW